MRTIIFAVSLILFFPALAQKNDNVISSYGKHVIWGQMTDGDPTHPGEKPKTIQLGMGYTGILLDTPIDIRPLLNQLDPQVIKFNSSLQRGFLDHIQVDFTKTQKQFYDRFYGKRVRITCNIDFVGRFYTPIYCEALGVEPVWGTSPEPRSN
ncbi:hypothetical protein ACQ4OC_19260 [Yersinia sp. J1]|uniref:hypothetical protein n=1 Tax=Yersinia sp. J1 TaxID=3424774 RepID=UPI003D36C642